jgi:hypothetical protein
VDLRAARVDEADEKTGLPFTIRVAEAKQNFYYLQCSGQGDRDEWMGVLRRAAGYRPEHQVEEHMFRVRDAAAAAAG